MHIPDGFLDAKTLLASAALATTGVGAALWQAQRQLTPRQVPLVGLTAAFVFAAQLVNFPVASGTSGHLLGGVLAAVLVGPAAAVVVLTAVLLVQSLLFQDGGLLALGANIFNLAVVAPLGGALLYGAVYRLLGGPAAAQAGGDRRQILASALVAGWGSMMLAALCCAGQLAWSGTVSARLAFPAMAGVHALIGLGEGLITGLVLQAIRQARPASLAPGAAAAQPLGLTQWLPASAWTLAIVAGLALFVSPFACAWPDGLEKVAEHLGFEAAALAHPIFPAPFPDYSLPAWGNSGWGTIGVGLAGSLVVVGLCWALLRLRRAVSAGTSNLSQV